MRIFLKLGLLIFSSVLFAQWNLEKCIGYAEQNNLVLRKMENNSAIAEATLDQARATRLPSLNASASNNYNFGRNIDPFTNQFTTSRVRSNNFSLVSSVTLFSGLQLQYSVKQSERDVAALKQDMEEQKRQLYFEIAASYMDVRLQQELLKQAKQRALLSKESYDRAVQLSKGGVLAESETTELLAQWKRDEVSIATAEAQVQTSILLLKNSMTFPLEQDFEVDSTAMVLEIEEYQLDSCLNAAMKNHPGMKAAEFREQSARWAYRVAYARYFPRLSLNASVSTLYSSSARQIASINFSGFQYVGFTQNSLDTVLAPQVSPEYERKPFDNQIRDNYNRFIGFTLSIPVFNGLQVRKSVTRARLSMKNSELDTQIKENSIRQEVVRNFAEHKNAQATFSSAQISKDASAQALAQAEKRLNAGQATAFDLTQARQRMALAEAEETRSRFYLAYRQAILQFYFSNKF